MKILCTILLGAAVCMTVACQTKTTPAAKKDAAGPVQPLQAAKEGIIKVQHILIAFDGTIITKNVTRTKAEAEQLANEVLAKAQAGEDFDALVKTHTDDSAPGIYSLADFGVDNMMTQDVIPRSDMVKAFGDVSFQLKVGEVGLAEYSKSDSQFGWHIIKRLE
ncbi:MAG: peptidylprolyl isomerase [Planctomycetaceae bacterium]|nr:peptidylprolyl isomerase [Planctomycetaceae bacterium]